MEFLKVNYKKISIVLVFFIVISFITTQTLVPEATKREPKVVDGMIRILEIEPGDRFYLTNYGKDNGYVTPKEEVYTKGDYSAHITHVSMAEFISMVSDVNGEYDIVLVGRDKNKLNTKYSTGIAFRDYTSPQAQEMPHLPVTSWNKDENDEYDRLSNFSEVDGKILAEFYSENDITEKRAKEIMEMIDTSQLVVMDSAIFNADLFGKTKLYNIFNELANKKFKTLTWQNMSLENIMGFYNEIDKESKRPNVAEITEPLEETEDRSMTIDIKLSDDSSDKLTVNLYLDINADGLFKEKELVRSFAINSKETQEFTIDYTLNNDFVGYLDWKVEIVRENGVKRNLYGNIVFKNAGAKNNIKVLQIIPFSKSEEEKNPNGIYVNGILCPNIKLNEHENFNKLLEQVKDYNIEVDTISIDELNENLESGYIKIIKDEDGNKSSITSLNGNYNMVIVGFSDSYGFKQFSSKAVDEIENFIATGQSVMLTHDTITPVLADEYETLTGPKLLTQRLRDFAGQSRYIDPYRNSELDIYKTEQIMKDSEGNIVAVNMVDRTIPHESFDLWEKAGYEIGEVYTLGATLQGYIGGWEANIEEVIEVNKALISSYPFKLTDEKSNMIKVSPTHTQWFQLNLEDEDVVPWFNLNSTARKFDSGDSRNNYYTYSKGNITYSGTGHTSSKFPDDELKLFINTIVKAERSANHAPTVKVANLDGIEMHKNQLQHKFTITPSDLDRDLMTIEVKYYGIKDGVETELLDNNRVLENKLSDETFDAYVVNIDGTQFENYSEVKIEIVATDIWGATSETVTKIINIVDTPLLDVTFSMPEGVNGYLMGDTAVLETKFNRISEEDTSSYTNLAFKLENLNEVSNYLELKSNYNTLQLGNLVDENINSAKGEFSFNVKSNTNISADEKEVLSINNIKGDYYYNADGTGIAGERIGSINIRRGQIQIDVRDITDVSISKIANVTLKNVQTGQTYKNNSDNFKNGVIVFDLMPSGDYIVELGELPKGYSINDDKKIQDLTINYNNSIGKVRYNVDGTNPNITATLQGVSETEVYPGESTTVKYTIDADPVTDYDFVGGNEGGLIEEAMFILDLSLKTKNNMTWAQFRNGIVEGIINDGVLSEYINYGMIGYHNEFENGEFNSTGDILEEQVNSALQNGETVVNNVFIADYEEYFENSARKLKSRFDTPENLESLVNPLFNMKDDNGNIKNAFRILLQEQKLDGAESYVYGQVSNREESNYLRDATKAISLADTVLTRFGDRDKSKAIILVNSGKVNYDEEVIRNIREKGYSIITMDLSGSNSIEPTSNKLHSDLGGRDGDYFCGTVDSGDNYNDVIPDMKNVAESLKNGTKTEYPTLVVPVDLNFDLGSNLTFMGNVQSTVRGLSTEGNSRTDINLKPNTTLNGTKLNIKIPDIVYNYDKDTKTYIAESQSLEFDVKVNIDVIEDKVYFGNHGNKEFNNISYENFMNKQVIKLVETPIIGVRLVSDLTHGLYRGTNANGQAIIEQSPELGFEMVVGMDVNYAATCLARGRNTELELILAAGLPKGDSSDSANSNANNIKVYKTVLTGTRIEYQEVDNFTIKRVGATYKILVADELQAGTELLIKYSATMPNAKVLTKYTNIIKQRELEADVTVFTKDMELPDLF